MGFVTETVPANVSIVTPKEINVAVSEDDIYVQAIINGHKAFLIESPDDVTKKEDDGHMDNDIMDKGVVSFRVSSLLFSRISMGQKVACIVYIVNGDDIVAAASFDRVGDYVHDGYDAKSINSMGRAMVLGMGIEDARMAEDVSIVALYVLVRNVSFSLEGRHVEDGLKTKA